MGKRLNDLRKRLKKLERQVGDLQQIVGKAQGGKGRKKRSKTKTLPKKAPKKPTVARTATHGKSVARAHIKPAEKAEPVQSHAPAAMPVQQ
jgi:hypothetical protein